MRNHELGAGSAGSSGSGGDPAGELAGVLHQLRLQAVNDEITLLSESGDLSDEARQQHRRLLEELRTLKAGPATARE